MKKFLTVFTMLLALGGAVEAAALTPTPNAKTELVDSASQDALEAYSDTTQTADTPLVSAAHRMGGGTVATSLGVGDLLGNLDAEDLAGMAFALFVLLIIFVVSPVGIIVAVFYFLNKSRRQKMQLAQAAMEKGQPIPSELLGEPQQDADELWQKGWRQLSLGVGLMFFLGYTAGRAGFGVGVLVACIGLGKLVIAKTSKKKVNEP